MTVKKSISCGVLLAGSLLVLTVLIIRNPFNSFVKKSDHFSFRAFRTIEVGTPISAAIEMMGAPVRVEPLGGAYWRCPECSAYCFACNPPDWLIGYKEAWIYAGPDGLVRETFINTEP